MDDSIKFYTEILGMEIAEKREKTEPTRGEVVTLKSPNSNQLLELNFYEKESEFYTPYVNGEDLDHLAFDVKDLEHSISDLKKRDVEVVINRIR
jgi:catechol 2,3-dioxygenase-like lactoylglutathione lyase family enzyme